MNIILFEDQRFTQLLPLTFTKPACELRIGILTLKEKWQKYLPKATLSHLPTREYLKPKYPVSYDSANTYINNRCIASESMVGAIQELEMGQGLKHEGGQILAFKTDKNLDEVANNVPDFTWTQHICQMLDYPEQIFAWNDTELESDFELITAGRKSQTISNSNQCIAPERIFLEEGARVECSILNASKGPIYIGKNAEIMEGCMVRGGLALCEGGVLKMGAKIYGATTVGPFSKVGGEVNNSVILGYSNKGHDGFLGNSVVGEWCNLGADTNTSNLKNNYAEVKLWDYELGRFRQTGLQFCGLIIGDHSKCGINTMFNTGTVVGICSNIFGSGFPRNYVPSFAWGGASGFTTYRTRKVFEVAEVVMKRRDVPLEQIDKDIIQAVFEQTEQNRFWERS